MTPSSCILIIDDEVQIRRLLEITLTANEYKVIEALTGKEGLMMAASHQPVLIILDLGLPVSTELIYQETREWYQKPILFFLCEFRRRYYKSTRQWGE
jgi:two-component system KDP operon response regulator KdpE